MSNLSPGSCSDSSRGSSPASLSTRRGEGTLIDIVLGVVGAVVGGFVFNLVGATGVTGFNIWSLLRRRSSAPSCCSSRYHAITGRRPTAV